MLQARIRRRVLSRLLQRRVLDWVHDHRPVLRGIVVRPPWRGPDARPDGRGGPSAADVVAVLDEVTALPRWREYFADCGFPLRLLTTPGSTGPGSLRLHCDRPAWDLVPKDMVHAGREGLAGWLRTTWMPYLRAGARRDAARACRVTSSTPTWATESPGRRWQRPRENGAARGGGREDRGQSERFLPCQSCTVRETPGILAVVRRHRIRRAVATRAPGTSPWSFGREEMTTRGSSSRSRFRIVHRDPRGSHQGNHRQRRQTLRVTRPQGGPTNMNDHEEPSSEPTMPLERIPHGAGRRRAQSGRAHAPERIRHTQVQAPARQPSDRLGGRRRAGGRRRRTVGRPGHDVVIAHGVVPERRHGAGSLRRRAGARSAQSRWRTLWREIGPGVRGVAGTVDKRLRLEVHDDVEHRPRS